MNIVMNRHRPPPSIFIINEKALAISVVIYDNPAGQTESSDDLPSDESEDFSWHGPSHRKFQEQNMSL